MCLPIFSWKRLKGQNTSKVKTFSSRQPGFYNLGWLEYRGLTSFTLWAFLNSIQPTIWAIKISYYFLQTCSEFRTTNTHKHQYLNSIYILFHIQLVKWLLQSVIDQIIQCLSEHVFLCLQSHYVIVYAVLCVLGLQVCNCVCVCGELQWKIIPSEIKERVTLFADE